MFLWLITLFWLASILLCLAHCCAVPAVCERVIHNIKCMAPMEYWICKNHCLPIRVCTEYALIIIFLQFLSGACGITKVHVGSEPINFNLTSYPTGYPPSLDCNWNIIAPDFMSLVHVGISDFSTEYLKDVAVLKGININGKTVSFVMTGSIDKLISITLNSSEEVSFSFKSDSYVSGPGFLLELYSSNGNFSCKLSKYLKCCFFVPRRTRRNIDKP